MSRKKTIIPIIAMFTGVAIITTVLTLSSAKITSADTISSSDTMKQQIQKALNQANSQDHTNLSQRTPWKMIWFLVKNQKASGVDYVMNSNDVKYFDLCKKQFEEHLEKVNPNLDIQIEPIYIDDVVDVGNTPGSPNFNAPNANHIKKYIDQYAPVGKYDTVMAFSMHCEGGVAGTTHPIFSDSTVNGAGFCYILQERQNGGFFPNANPNQSIELTTERAIHEWNHQLEQYSVFGFKMESLHNGSDYGYTQDPLNGWTKFYNDILNGKMYDSSVGKQIGVYPEMWKITPTALMKSGYTNVPSNVPGGKYANVQILYKGQYVAIGDSQKSQFYYKLTLENDGNLALYDKDSKKMWESGTSGKGGDVAVMQPDGNLVIYHSPNDPGALDFGAPPIWSSGTFGSAGSQLVLQADGNLVMYNKEGKVIWETKTGNSTQISGDIKVEDWMSNYNPSAITDTTQNTTGNATSTTTNSTTSNATSGNSIKSVDITRLNKGQSSSCGEYRLTMQTDGNLVLYNKDSKPLWASNTYLKGGEYAVMQQDGNFVVYNGQNAPLWAAGTDRNPGSKLKLQSDGNLVITDTTGKTIWNSSNSSGNLNNTASISAVDVKQLKKGESVSCGGYRLSMETNGNLVLYNKSSKGIWTVYTYVKGGEYAVMKEDGNFVICNGKNVQLWASKTDRNKGAKLKLQSDGNLVIYNSDGKAIWSTGTFGK